MANVTPIYKKGSKNDAGNYRPVSLTSVPCKILESIMKDVMVDYLESAGFYNHCQLYTVLSEGDLHSPTCSRH